MSPTLGWWVRIEKSNDYQGKIVNDKIDVQRTWSGCPSAARAKARSIREVDGMSGETVSRRVAIGLPHSHIK